MLGMSRMWMAVTRANAYEPNIYYNSIMSLSPMAYWRLGESSGTTAFDETGTHHGTYVNNPTLGESGLLVGDGDTAVTFEPTEYVTVVPITGVQSFSCLFKSFDTTADYQALANSYIDNTDRFTICINGQPADTSPMLLIANGIFVQGDTQVTDGLRHHCVVSYNGVTTDWWVDGIKQTNSFSGNMFSYGGGFEYISAYKYNSAVEARGTGTMDEVAIFPTALTQEQVIALYQASIGNF